MAYIKVAATSEIKEGEIKQFLVQGREIAIARVNGDFFAIDDRCTHADCSLGKEGMLEGDVVVCGCHGAMFDLKTGKVLALPAVSDLATFRLKVEKDTIFIKI